jgi:hypothetical protein
MGNTITRSENALKNFNEKMESLLDLILGLGDESDTQTNGGKYTETAQGLQCK